VAVFGGEFHMIPKPLSAMTEEEKEQLLSGEPDIEDLLEDDEVIPAGRPMWHESSRDRQNFASSIDKPPKRNFLSRLISDDDPSTLKKYPKGTKIPSGVVQEIEPEINYDINEPGEVLKPQKIKKDRSWLRDAGRMVLWIVHAFLMIGILYFTYYAITLVKSPGITDFAAVGTLIVIISIQISLFSVNTFVGTVIRR
jgi:hypothetical protein